MIDLSQIRKQGEKDQEAVIDALIERAGLNQYVSVYDYTIEITPAGGMFNSYDFLHLLMWFYAGELEEESRLKND